MKELYNEYFHIPKQGKIRDKVMLVRVVLTAFVMIACLGAMSITAYAYFSYNVTSGSNMIKAADFNANVSIYITDPSNTAVPVTQSDDKTYSANLTAGTYTVKLTKGESTAKTGFCIITIGETKYYTQQIGADKERNLTDAGVNFTLKVSEETKITFLSHWGTSSYYGYTEESHKSQYIVDGAKMDLSSSANGTGESNSTEEQGTTGESTSTAETTPPTSSTTTAKPTTAPITETTLSTETTQPAETTTTETTYTTTEAQAETKGESTEWSSASTAVTDVSDL